MNIDPPALVLAFVLGMVLGIVFGELGLHPVRGHVIYMVAVGLVFFVPLALLRSFEGSDPLVYATKLESLVLWIIFVLAVGLGIRIGWARK